MCKSPLSVKYIDTVRPLITLLDDADGKKLPHTMRIFSLIQ